MTQVHPYSKWTLFLDRDGVINEKLSNDYVKLWDEFVFIPGALTAIARLSHMFGKIFIVTNQRGVGLGYMSEAQLIDIHSKMLSEISIYAGRIDKVYYCIDKENESLCRKPNIGMGLKAKNDFPEIDFNNSVILGDSLSDMEFGKNLGMKTVFVFNESQFSSHVTKCDYDYKFQSINEFSLELSDKMFL